MSVYRCIQLLDIPFSLALNEQHSDILDLFVVLGISCLSSKEIGDLSGWISFLEFTSVLFGRWVASILEALRENDQL